MSDWFATREVRDLAWVIKSPVLLNAHCPPHQSTPVVEADTGFSVGVVIDDSWCELQMRQHWNWLRCLDVNPQPLLDWLHPRYNPRLGYYFESLVEFWLRHAFAGQVLVPHLQVKNDKRTIGEFDYLIADSRDKTVHHWEVAVKFYLHYRHSDGRLLWYGPNPRDRLDLKLQRLFGHQLPLSLRPEATRALRRAGLAWPVLPRLFLKGYLFYPANSHWREHASPAELSPHHLRGWWTHVGAFEIPNANNKDRRWMYLPRLQWLAPAVSGASTTALLNIEQLHGFCLDLLQRKQKPPLIAEMGLTDSGGWQEVSRGFVVPQHWPGIHPNQ